MLWRHSGRSPTFTREGSQIQPCRAAIISWISADFSKRDFVRSGAEQHTKKQTSAQKIRGESVESARLPNHGLFGLMLPSSIRVPMLPDIDFALAIEPKTFLQDMAQIGRETGLFEVEEHFDALGEDGFHVVNFHYRKPTSHPGLGGQLISRADVPGRIIVEMRAERWQPDPPSREIYCAATRALIWPLMASYNKAQGVRLRLRIEKRYKGLVPTPRTEKLFQRFVILANKSSLHPRDWQRFYELVAVGRQEIPIGDLRSKLQSNGFPREKAEYLADIYDHLWRYKNRKQSS